MSETPHNDDDVTTGDDYQDEAEAIDAFVTTPPAPVKRGVGWGVVLPLFLLAGLGGAAGGWALTQYVMPQFISPPASVADAPKVNLDPLISRIETLEKKLAGQSSELSFLSSEVKSGAASVTVSGVDETLDITPLLSRMAALEDRLEAKAADGKEVPVPVLDEAGEPLAMESYLNGFEARLVTLEKTARENRAAVDFDGLQIPPDLTDELETLQARLKQLEGAVTETRALAAAPTIVRDTVLLPPFPREALLEAMTAPRSQDAQGWIGKTLKKHISVRDPEDVARASATLDEVEGFIETQNYAGALRLIETLPSDVRSVAADWIRAVKAELETR